MVNIVCGRLLICVFKFFSNIVVVKYFLFINSLNKYVDVIGGFLFDSLKRFLSL